jgi:hypothetical protein
MMALVDDVDGDFFFSTLDLIVGRLDRRPVVPASLDPVVGCRVLAAIATGTGATVAVLFGSSASVAGSIGAGAASDGETFRCFGIP